MRRHYVGIDTVLSGLPGRDVVLEERPGRWMFGCRNYGEVADNWHNRADGDRWDVFAPGYAGRLDVRRPYTVTGILGVLWMDNGNHKIAVRLSHRGYDEARARAEIARYVHEYPRRMRKQGVWLE